MKIRYFQSARREMLRDARWYRDRRQGLDDEFLVEIEAVIRLIKTFPEAGSIVETVYRRLIVKRFPYNIIYRVTATEIVIVAVAHQKKRPDYWHRRRA